MRLFWELTWLSIRKHITYRAATFAGLMTNFFFGLLRAAVMVALYGARQEVAGMTLQDAITFTGLTQAVIAFLSLFSWYDIIHSVHSGQIGSDLLKPINYFTYWLAQDLGRAVVNLVLRGLIIMIFYAIVFDISRPDSLRGWFTLIIAMTLAWITSFSFRFLINLLAFWSPDARGYGRLFFSLSWFLSGFLMPMRFLPDWFVKLCYLTPFPHMINTIIEIYLGLLSREEILQALQAQAIWIIILIGTGQLVFNAGVKRLVIQGG
jgi:ABC-2 type transport system permease protein